MHCLECRKQLNIQEQQQSALRFELDLCEGHRTRMERVMDQHDVPEEAVMLYYHLKNSDIQSMLAWWDGTTQIDLAISRVKLNISIEKSEQNTQLPFPEFVRGLAQLSLRQENGFSFMKIPAFQIRNYPAETVEQVRNVIQEIRQHIKIS